MTHHIAVDIGGTQIRAALYDSERIIPEKLNRISTQGDNLTALERLKSVIASVWPSQGVVEGIAVAAPGPVDPYHGIIFAAPNIPGWVDLPLSNYLEDRFQVPVALGNDANMAALGEWKFGAGQDHHDLLYLTVSTGIGGGVIINDQLLLGHEGLATELGHVTIMQDGPICGCGKTGHLEALASGTGITNWFVAQLAQGAETSLPKDQPLSAKMIAQAAQKGDALSIAAFNRAGFFLGQGIANYLHIFNPSIVIIGGGVSLSGRLIMDPLSESLKIHVITPHYLDGLTLTTSALGDDAGLLGSLALARSLSPRVLGSEEVAVEPTAVPKTD